MFHYNKLDVGSKAIYRTILTALQKHQTKIYIKEAVDDAMTIRKSVEAIHLDHPLLFYVDFSSFSMRVSMGQTTLTFRFLYTEDQIREKTNALREVIAKFGKVQHRTSLEKEITIHNALAKRMTYHRCAEEDEESHTIVGALLHKKAVCDGFAKAFKAICDACGIECIVVVGALRTEREREELHAWNMVNIDRYWHHVDLTGDEVVTLSEEIVLCDYFNVGDCDITGTHTWDEDYYPSATTGFYAFCCRAESLPETERYIVSRIQNHSYTLRLKVPLTAREGPRDCLQMVDRILKKNRIRFKKIEGCYNESLKLATIHVTV